MRDLEFARTYQSHQLWWYWCTSESNDSYLCSNCINYVLACLTIWLVFGLHHSNLTPAFLKSLLYTFCVKALSRVTIMIIQFTLLAVRRFNGIWMLPQVYFMSASCMGVVIPNSSLQCHCDCDTVAGLPCSLSDCGLSGFCVILQSFCFILKLWYRVLEKLSFVHCMASLWYVANPSNVPLDIHLKI